MFVCFIPSFPQNPGLRARNVQLGILSRVLRIINSSRSWLQPLQLRCKADVSFLESLLSNRASKINLKCVWKRRLLFKQQRVRNPALE